MEGTLFPGFPCTGQRTGMDKFLQVRSNVVGETLHLPLRLNVRGIPEFARFLWDARWTWGTGHGAGERGILLQILRHGSSRRQSRRTCSVRVPRSPRGGDVGVPHRAFRGAVPQRRMGSYVPTAVIVASSARKKTASPSRLIRPCAGGRSSVALRGYCHSAEDKPPWGLSRQGTRIRDAEGQARRARGPDLRGTRPEAGSGA